MKTFYILLSAVAVAGLMLAFDRLTNNQHRPLVQAVVAGMLIIIFVFFFRFLSKMRD